MGVFYIFQGSRKIYPNRKMLKKRGFCVCALDMIDIDRQLITSFWSHEISLKKGSRIIYISLFKVISLKRSIL